MTSLVHLTLYLLVLPLLAVVSCIGLGVLVTALSRNRTPPIRERTPGAALPRFDLPSPRGIATAGAPGHRARVHEDA